MNLFSESVNEMFSYNDQKEVKDAINFLLYRRLISILTHYIYKYCFSYYTVKRDCHFMWDDLIKCLIRFFWEENKKKKQKQNVI